MKRPIYSGPDAFSLSPLLAVLPVKGRISALESLSASLFARYEKVRELESAGSDDALELAQGRADERNMLREVLDWLEISPGGPNG